MCKGHLLSGRLQAARARRAHCDDVLYRVYGGPAVAVVPRTIPLNLIPTGRW